jgi:hypothetical protein
MHFYILVACATTRMWGRFRWVGRGEGIEIGAAEPAAACGNERKKRKRANYWSHEKGKEEQRPACGWVFSCHLINSCVNLYRHHTIIQEENFHRVQPCDFFIVSMATISCIKCYGKLPFFFLSCGQIQPSITNSRVLGRSNMACCPNPFRLFVFRILWTIETPSGLSNSCIFPLKLSPNGLFLRFHLLHSFEGNICIMSA